MNIISSLRHRHLILPTALAVGSFCFLAVLVLFTSPLTDINYAILFFLGFVFFLPSISFLAIKARRGQVGAKAKYRIFITTALVIIILMFRSAQSLNLLDLIILLGVMAGMFFYGGRRLG